MKMMMKIIGLTLITSSMALAGEGPCGPCPCGVPYVGGHCGGNSEFAMSGTADVVAPLSEAENAMRLNAEAQCGAGTLTVQISETEFTLYPRSYPTKRIATATFECQPGTRTPSLMGSGIHRPLPELPTAITNSNSERVQIESIDPNPTSGGDVTVSYLLHCDQTFSNLNLVTIPPIALSNPHIGIEVLAVSNGRACQGADRRATAHVQLNKIAGSWSITALQPQQ